MSGDSEEDRSCLFIKGFPSNFSVILPEVRSFFQERVGNCSVKMKEVSKDKRYLYIVVGFDSPEVAADVLERFDGKHVLGHKVKMSYWRVHTEKTMKERQQKSLCKVMDIDARNRSSRSYVEHNEVHTSFTVDYAKDQGSWSEGSRELTVYTKQADSFNKSPRCEELMWADTRYHAPNDYLPDEQYSLYHLIRNGRDVNSVGRKGSYDLAESHQLDIRLGSYCKEGAWQNSETHREFGLDVVDNQYFVDIERDINDYVFNKGCYGEQFNYNSKKEHFDRSYFEDERLMAVEEGTKQSLSLGSENSFYASNLVKGEGCFNMSINDQSKNTRPQFDQANARMEEKDLDYDPRDSRPPVVRRKPWIKRQAEVPTDRSKKGLSELSPGTTPRDLPEVAAVAGPRPSRRLTPSLRREAEEHLEGTPRSGGWSRHSRNQFRDSNRQSASPGSQQNVIKNNRRRQSPSFVDRTVEASYPVNAEESFQMRKSRRSLSAERDFHLNSLSDWNRGSYINDLKRHETVATRRTGRATRRYSIKERASLLSGRTASACGSKGIEGDGNSKRLEKLSPRRSENDLRNLLILRKQAKQTSVGGGVALNNNNKRETKPSLIGKGSKSPLTSPCSQSSPESRLTARRVNRKRQRGDDTETKTKHKAEISKKPRRELNVHVSQDASSCSSLTSKEGRNNKLLKDSDEPALSDGYHRKEKFPGSRRNLLKEHYKGINSPNKLKSNNGHKADSKRTDRLLNELGPVCLSEVSIPLGGTKSNGSDSKQGSIAIPKTCQGPLTEPVLYSTFEDPFPNEIYGQERNATVDVTDECMASNRLDKETLEASQTDAAFPENSFRASPDVGIPGDESMELNVAKKYYPPITVSDCTRQERKEESFYHDIQTCESYLDGAERRDDLVPIRKIANFCIESKRCHCQDGNCTSCPHQTAPDVDSANNATDNSLLVFKESSGFCENASFLVNDCFSERERTPSPLEEDATVCENGKAGGIGCFHQHSKTRTRHIYKTSEEFSFNNPGLPFCPKDVYKNAWESKVLSQYSANCQQIDMEISSNEEFPIRNSSNVGNLGASDEGLTYRLNDSCEGAVRRELTINSSRNMKDDCQEVDMEFSSDEATHNPSPRIMETDMTLDHRLQPETSENISETGNVVPHFDITRPVQTMRGRNMVSGVLQTDEHCQETEGCGRNMVSGVLQTEQHYQETEGRGRNMVSGVLQTDEHYQKTEGRERSMVSGVLRTEEHYQKTEGRGRNMVSGVLQMEEHCQETEGCGRNMVPGMLQTEQHYQETEGRGRNMVSGVLQTDEHYQKTEGRGRNMVSGVLRTEQHYQKTEGANVIVSNKEQEGDGQIHTTQQRVHNTESANCDTENQTLELYLARGVGFNHNNLKEETHSVQYPVCREAFDIDGLYPHSPYQEAYNNKESGTHERLEGVYCGERDNSEKELYSTEGTLVEGSNTEPDVGVADQEPYIPEDVGLDGHIPEQEVYITEGLGCAYNSENHNGVYNMKEPTFGGGNQEKRFDANDLGAGIRCFQNVTTSKLYLNGKVSDPLQSPELKIADLCPLKVEASNAETDAKALDLTSYVLGNSYNCRQYSPSSATWKTCRDRLDSPNDNLKPNQSKTSKDRTLFPTLFSKRKGDKNHFSSENDTSVPPEHRNDCNNNAPDRSRRLGENKRKSIARRDWDGDMTSNGFQHQVDVEISADDGQSIDPVETEHSHRKQQLIGCPKETSSANESFSWKNAKTSESIGDVNLANSTNNYDDKAENKRHGILMTPDVDRIQCVSENTKQSLKHHSNTICSPSVGPTPNTEHVTAAETYHSSNEKGAGHKDEMLYATNDRATKPDRCLSFDETLSGRENHGIIAQGFSEEPRSGSSRMQNELPSTTITDKGTTDGLDMPACQLGTEPLFNSIIDEAKSVKETVKNVGGTKLCSVKNENAGDKHLENGLAIRSCNGISFTLPRESPIQPPISRTADLNETCYHDDTATSPKADVDSNQSTLRAMDIAPLAATAFASSDDLEHQSSKCHLHTNDDKTQSDSQNTSKDYNNNKSAGFGDSFNNPASSLMDYCSSLGKNTSSQRNAPSFDRGISCQEINTTSKARSPDNTPLLKDSADSMASDYRVSNQLSTCPNGSSIAGEIIKSVENTQHNAEAASVEPSWECKMDSSYSSVSSSNRNPFLSDDTSEKVSGAKTGYSFSRLIESPHTVTGNGPLTAGQEHATCVRGSSENKVQGTTFFSVHVPKTAESASDSTSHCAIKSTLPVLHVGAAAPTNMNLKLATVKESDWSAKTTVDADTCETPLVSATVSCTDNRLSRQWNPPGNSSTSTNGSRATLPSEGSSRQENSSKVSLHAGNLRTMSRAPALVCESNTKSQRDGREHSVRAPPSLSMASHGSDIEGHENSARAARAPQSLSMAPYVRGIKAKNCSALNKMDTRAAENTSAGGSKDSTSCTRTENELIALKMERLRKKKEEIEEVYRRECRTVINVVKLLVSNDPRLESLLQNAVRRSLHEMGRRCVQELEKHVRLGT